MEEMIALTPPEPALPVPVEKAAGMVKLDERTLSQLDQQVAQFIQDITLVDVSTPEFLERTKVIHDMGVEEIQASASMSNRMLQRPVAAMREGLFDEKSTISRGLIDLRHTVEDLDPSGQGDLLRPRKLFGLIPFGSRLVEYFDRYRSAQSHLDAIIQALYRGQDELKKDNAAIEQEKVNQWSLMRRMEQFVYIGKKLDAELESRVAQVESTDVEKARVIREEVLFYVRQKVMDLLTQLAVNIQGYLALDLIRKNNLELIKGVDRATSTTISALRTAVMVAQALANQKLVLDQITALNTTTGNLIESTSGLLKSQAADIHKQAAGSTIELEKLKTAFRNVYDAMDMISSFKAKALESMGQTVETLSGEVEKAGAYVDKVRSMEVRALTEELGSDLGDGVVSLMRS